MQSRRDDETEHEAAIRLLRHELRTAKHDAKRYAAQVVQLRQELERERHRHRRLRDRESYEHDSDALECDSMSLLERALALLDKQRTMIRTLVRANAQLRDQLETRPTHRDLARNG
ncbi:hypothetical protein ATCC90586_008908 [Pythium insidiosum]|nr:hypothetical protein ATCC90586_008908 [Pythium insidiosum]